MKKFAIIIFVLIVFGSLFNSCTSGKKSLDFVVIDSTYNVGGVDYPADFCKMQVFEDPSNVDSKIIELPVIRIRTSSNDPGAPVFMLGDGPGLSNFTQIIPTWLIENHDVIIVGYRGVDGSINLDLPEYNRTTQNSNFLSESNINLAAKALSKGLKMLSDSLEIDINQYNIVNMAHDLDAARNALVYKKINFYAIGFGARIAQAYGSIAPDNIFRVFMERPKAYGTLGLHPKDIEQTLEFYDEAATNINGGITFSKNIIKGLEALPESHEGHNFDKDRIIYSVFNLMESNQGPAAINEAFLAAQKGDYEGIKYLDEYFSTNSPIYNFADYAVKSATSEFDKEQDYIKIFDRDNNFAIGSPLSRFIFGSLQKSGLEFALPDSVHNNPTKSAGECLMCMANLSISAPYEKAEFELSKSYAAPVSIILSDYNAMNLRTHRIKEYSDLIASFIYIGEYKSFVPDYKAINLIPEKTFKQLYIERIQ